MHSLPRCPAKQDASVGSAWEKKRRGRAQFSAAVPPESCGSPAGGDTPPPAGPLGLLTRPLQGPPPWRSRRWFQGSGFGKFAGHSASAPLSSGGRQELGKTPPRPSWVAGLPSSAIPAAGGRAQGTLCGAAGSSGDWPALPAAHGGELPRRDPGGGRCCHFLAPG